MTLVDDAKDLINRNRPAAVWGGAFLFVLLLSLILFLALANHQAKVVIFFPGNNDHRLSGEQRIVPRSRSLDSNVATVVNGLILGPMQLRHNRAIAKDTTIRALFIKNRVAYIDLSPDVLFPSQDVALSFDESIAAIRKTVLFNFRQLDRVIVTVNGQEPPSEVSAKY